MDLVPQGFGPWVLPRKPASLPPVRDLITGCWCHLSHFLGKCAIFSSPESQQVSDSAPVLGGPEEGAASPLGLSDRKCCRRASHAAPRQEVIKHWRKVLSFPPGVGSGRPLVGGGRPTGPAPGHSWSLRKQPNLPQWPAAPVFLAPPSQRPPAGSSAVSERQLPGGRGRPEMGPRPPQEEGEAPRQGGQGAGVVSGTL